MLKSVSESFKEGVTFVCLIRSIIHKECQAEASIRMGIHPIKAMRKDTPPTVHIVGASGRGLDPNLKATTTAISVEMDKTTMINLIALSRANIDLL